MTVGRRGFTLIEVAIAMAIGMIILVVLDQVFVSGARTFTRGTRGGEAMVGAVLLLETLSNDLAQVWVDEETAYHPIGGPGAGATDGAGAGAGSGAGGLGSTVQSLDLAQKPLAFKIATARGTGEDVDTLDLSYWLEPSGVSGVSRVLRNGKELPDVFVKSMIVDFFPYGHPDSAGIEYVRVEVEATDHQGLADFALARLVALPVPSALAARRRAREAGRAADPQERGP